MVTSSQIGRNGRFGNQLFQISALVGFGLKNSLDIALPKWYCELSDVCFDKYFPNYHIKDVSGYCFETYNELSYSYNEIPPMDNLDINGYFQSYKYFNDFDYEIRKIFTPHFDIKMKSDNFVSLHVRMGDYKLHSQSHVNLGQDYYKRAYDYYGHDKTYLVFSDASEFEVFNFLPFIKNKVYMSNNKELSNIYIGSDKNVVFDLFEMSSCNKHIIANSSLSWWGAWLGDGDTVAPSDWFTYSYGKSIGYKENDLIPNKWKIL